MSYGITKDEAKELDTSELQARLAELMVELQYEQMQSRRMSGTMSSIENVRAELARKKGQACEQPKPLENMYL
jgi:ribosomal protein L29